MSKTYPSILEQLYESTDNLELFTEEYFYALPCNEAYIENQKQKKISEDLKKEKQDLDKIINILEKEIKISVNNNE
jgi:hypothetical protein